MGEPSPARGSAGVMKAVAAGVLLCAAFALLEWVIPGSIVGSGDAALHHLFLSFLILALGASLTAFLIFRDRYINAREKLAASEMRFRTAFRTSPDSININRLSDGLYIEVNEGFLALTGYAREEVVGKTSVELSIWSDLADRERLVAGLREKGEFQNLHAWFRIKDGSRKFCLMSAKIIMLDGVPHILSVTRDISDLKAAQDERRKSEEKYERIFQNMGDVYYEASLAGTLLEISPSVKTLLGYERELVLGEPIVKYYADPTQRDEFIRHLTTDGEVNDYWVVLTTNFGRTTHVSVNARLVDDAGHGDARYCGTIRDIEYQYRARKALAQSEEKYRALVEHANSMILRLTPGGEVIFANEFALEFLGFAPGELIGRNAVGLLFAPSEERDAGLYLEGRFTPGVFVAETLKKDGSRAFVNWSVSFYGEAPGTSGAALFVGNDVTARIEAERKLQAMEAHLAAAQKFEALGTLASGIAHDFNNVLSAIIGYAELSMLALPEGERARDHQANILAAANRAAQLVRQILTFARRADRQAIPVHLSPLARETVNFLRASLPANIEIRKDIATDGVVEGDPARIHQVLMNLCTNAVKAMPEGGILTVAAKIETIEEGWEPPLKPGKYYLLTVADTGVGMSEEVRARAFDPFFTTRGDAGGTGMGLAVVRGIVSDLGGEITVESAPGAGSSFRVYLPLIEGGQEAFAPESGIEPTGSELILLVEDEKLIADATARNLESLGYRVIVSLDANEALMIFRRTPGIFDLVIADMTMPGMTGDLLVSKLRVYRKDVPIILCSGFSERMNDEKARALCVSSYLQKPLTRGELARATRKALDGKVD